jgi:penicillin-insensitive murein endopeptidase
VLALLWLVDTETWPAREAHASVQSIVRIARLGLATVAAFAVLSLGAWPGAPANESLAAPRRTAQATLTNTRFGRSIGSPNEGKLAGGAHLEATPYLRIVPDYAKGDVRWGIEPLVQMLDRAARSVRRQFPDAVTSVGHLSRAGGGDIGRHHSHESGRDVDVGFFVRNKAGHPVLPDHFIAFHADGSAPHLAGAAFDDVRNWAFVHALLTDPGARVTHIFVAAPLRARLLAVAERLKASKELYDRAKEVMVQPKGALPHDDHFHVRIGCPAHMHECIENPTLHVAAHGARPRAGSAHATGPRGGAAHNNRTARHQETHPRTPAPPPKRDPYAEADEIDIVVDDPDGT